MSDHSHELVDDARLQHLHPYSPSVQMLQSFGVKTARAIATTAANAATLSLTTYKRRCGVSSLGGHLPEVYCTNLESVVVEKEEDE